jgi:hypothetical protein
MSNMFHTSSDNTTANASMTSPEDKDKRHTVVNIGLLSREGGRRRLSVRNSIVLQRRNLECCMIDCQDPSMRTALFMSYTDSNLAPMLTTLTPNQSSLSPWDLRRLLTKKVQESRRNVNTAPSTRESLSIDPTLCSNLPLEEAELEEDATKKPTERPRLAEIIEVAPGVEMPLISVDETWKAIMEGRITVTTCSCCTTELTCIDEAHLVVCADCWVFSPVDQAIAIATTIDQHRHQHGSSVAIGVKTEAILHWLSQHEDNDPVLGEVQQEE